MDAALGGNWKEAVKSLAVANPRAKAADGESFVKYGYGTAGFRADAGVLSSVFVRMGMLAALRGRSVGKTAQGDEGKAVGLMVTASHNKEADNGVKLIDPMGDMLDMAWEASATAVANAPEDQLGQVLQQVAKERGVNWAVKPRVMIGRDTRPSSPALAKLVAAGAEALGAVAVDFGLLTTPQLHWCVWKHNTKGPQQASVRNYNQTMAKAFSQVFRASSANVARSPLLIDCANGIGATALAAVAPLLNKEHLELRLCNEGKGALNEGVGADFVQKAKRLPKGVEDAYAEVGKQDKKEAPSSSLTGARLASVDGDADRLVYYTVDPEEKFKLLDGDKIIALVVLFLRSLLDQAKGAAQKLRIGVVQTAYANGASTKFITDKLKVPVECGKTGVKHLHHVAAAYDIGVYFEANGHGTCLFSPTAQRVFAEAQAESKPGTEAHTALSRLAALPVLINQCVGDAISDILLVECALADKGWSIADWTRLYQDLPSCMLAVRIKDRSVVRTINAERTCVAPEGLQAKIDQLVGENKGGERRAFVRASGTEDIVRVYAEAATPKEAEELANQVSAAVVEVCNSAA